MASGFGLKKVNLNINYQNILEKNKMYFNDIIAAVRFGPNLIGFYSMKDIYLKEIGSGYDLNSNFIYPEKDLIYEDFTQAIEDTLKDGNTYIGIVQKNSYIYSYYKDYKVNDYSQLFTLSEKLKNKNLYSYRTKSGFNKLMIEGMGLKSTKINNLPDKIEKENDYVLSDTNFKDIQGKKNGIYYLRVFSQPINIDTGESSGSGIINPKDLESFYTFFLNGSKSLYSDNYLRADMLPKICQSNLLIKMFSSKDSKFSSGYFCYGLENKNNAYVLYPNIEIDTGDLSIKNVYYNEGFDFFDFGNKAKRNNFCFPYNNFRINDKVIGYYKNGIYIQSKSIYLEKDYKEELDIFSKINNKNVNQSVTSRYPKISSSLIVSRPGKLFVPFGFSKPIPKDYIEGFYNTIEDFDTNKNIPSKFKNQLIRELITFCYLAYLENLEIENNPSKNYLLDLVDKLLKNKKINLGNSEDIKIFIFNITGNQENYVRATYNFFQNPYIIYGDESDVEFPILRYISYFINCESVGVCTQAITLGASNNFYTFDFLIKNKSNNSYYIYYNSENNIFTNVGP